MILRMRAVIVKGMKDVIAARTHQLPPGEND